MSSPANLADGWTHGPFHADVADGYVWGRGAVDMKGMVALEIRRPAAARRPGPGTRVSTLPGDAIRALAATCCSRGTADEEAGGWEGAGWVVDNRPDLLRAGGRRAARAGGVSADIAGRRLYPIQVAEKGHEVFRIHVHGTWGHGFMPAATTTALVMAAEAVRRLAEAGQAAGDPDHAAAAAGRATRLGPEQAAAGSRRSGEGTIHAGPRPRSPACATRCTPAGAACAHPQLEQPGRAPRRDEVQRDPGRGDDRDRHPARSPGTTPDDIREEVLARLGDLAPRCELERIHHNIPVEAPAEGELVGAAVQTPSAAHDPDGGARPGDGPVRDRRASTFVRIGVPLYGFSPLRLDPDERVPRAGSTASTSELVSRRSAGASPSSTTSSRRIAGETGARRPTQARRGRAGPGG